MGERECTSPCETSPCESGKDWRRGGGCCLWEEAAVSAGAGVRDVSMAAAGKKLDDVAATPLLDAPQDSSTAPDQGRSELVGGAQFSVGIGGVVAANTVLLNANAELICKVAALEQQNKCLASKLIASDAANKALEREKTALLEENERLKNLQSVEATSRSSQDSSTAEAGNLSVFLSCIIESTTRHNLAVYSTHFRQTLNKCCASIKVLCTSPLQICWR
jgi:hypothetical protein